MEEERKRPQGAAVDRAPVLSESLRILRLAESLNLSAETLAKIRAELSESIPASPPGGSEVLPVAEYPARYPKVETLEATAGKPAAEPVRVAPRAARVDTISPRVEPLVPRVPRDTATVSKPEPEIQSTSRETRRPALPDPMPLAAHAAVKAAPEAKQIDAMIEAELALRNKIELTQDWVQFKLEVWRLYERFPRPDTASRVVELALLYGSALDLEEVLVSLNRQSVAYLPMIDGSIRSHALIKLWQAKRTEFLDIFLFRKDLVVKLLPIERWYCTWSLLARGQGEQAFRWFKRYDGEIWGAQRQFGAVMQKSETELAFMLGQNALRAEDEFMALKLLETIPHQATEFPKALDLLLDIQIERDEKGLCLYGQKLNSELDWKARVGLLDSFLIRMQRLEHIAPKDRAALNALLADPLGWFPESAEALKLVAEVLLQYSSLERVLPNVLRIFHDRALPFAKPPMEHALWAPVLDHDFRNPLKNSYWRSIALVHEFAWGMGQDESKLWEARGLFHEALEYEGRALPISWQQLHQSLTQWITKSDRLDETARTSLLLTTKLAGETRDLGEDDVTNYLTHVPHPSGDVLDTLEALARDRQQWGLELFIHSRKASHLHHTNAGIRRIWELGYSLKRNDLCWRAATILKSRMAIEPELEKQWGISGEKRREYPLLELDESHLKRIFQCFEGYERRLVESLAHVGPLVPELLATLQPHLVPLKRGRSQTKNEIEVGAALDKMTWITPARKSFSANPTGLWQPKPSFFSNLIDSRWSVLFVTISQRLGISAWDWQLSLLNQQIETLIPRLTRSSESMAPGKVGRWLRALNPQQRKAWYDLAQMVKRFDDEKAQEIISRFVAILTTSMHQDHLSALDTLDRIRAPLRLRWDLENWIVSDAYGDIRKALKSQAITRLPGELVGASAEENSTKTKRPEM